MPFPLREQGGGCAPDFGPGVHKNDQIHRDRADVGAPSPVSCGVKQGPFLSSAPSLFFSQCFFLLGSSSFFMQELSGLLCLIPTPEQITASSE